jgi:hypothetical protein
MKQQLRKLLKKTMTRLRLQVTANAFLYSADHVAFTEVLK